MRVYPFMRYKTWYLVVLGLVTLLGILGVFIIGLQLGIEFQGGARVEVRFTEPATTSDVRSQVEAVGVTGAVVQPVGADSFLITSAAMTDEQFNQLIDAMHDSYGADKAAASLERVGPSFGRETAQRALIAVLISIVVMIGYISWRFEFKYALCAIVALIHDVALTLGIYSVTGRLVTTATVAAILTILGYSVNDTIIVFDRIRENTPLMKRETYSDMVDLSIRQTIVRSINTSLTTLLPVTSILLFGGATLKDFAFALFIGILAGAYSSIFVASPLLVILKQREKRYRKRLEAAKNS
jgi:preprotein translocase SecF subunit